MLDLFLTDSLWLQENEEVLHVDETVDPVRDMEIIHGELCAKDLQFILQAIDAGAIACHFWVYVQSSCG